MTSAVGNSYSLIDIVGGAVSETLPKTLGQWLDAAVSGAKIDSITKQQVVSTRQWISSPYFS